jgi:hypothetical protein
MGNPADGGKGQVLATQGSRRMLSNPEQSFLQHLAQRPADRSEHEPRTTLIQDLPALEV